MTEPTHAFINVTRVEIDQHRWYADIRIVKSDATDERIHVCADSEHSGLWLGNPDDHEEH